jgi:DNA repair protein RadC
MTINKWPLSERPREKLLELGAKNLTDAELIAIFMRTGIRGKTALDLSRDLLSDHGTLKKLFTMEPSYFYQKPGMGKAKYAMLKAALELGRRYLEENLITGKTLNNSQATKQFVANRLKDYPHEVFACLFLDNHHRILGFEELFHGTLTEASVYPREVVKRCLAHNAAKVIFAHNHPSGKADPSQADCELTQLLKATLALVDIRVIDHIVVGHQENVSLAETGLLSNVSD